MGIFYDRPTAYDADISGTYMNLGIKQIRKGSKWYSFRRGALAPGDFITTNGDYIDKLGKRFMKISYQGSMAYVKDTALAKCAANFRVPTTHADSLKGIYRVTKNATMQPMPGMGVVATLAVGTILTCYGYYIGSQYVCMTADYKIGYVTASSITKEG